MPEGPRLMEILRWTKLMKSYKCKNYKTIRKILCKKEVIFGSNVHKGREELEFGQKS